MRQDAWEGAVRHESTHDPLLEHRRCSVCSQALSAAFARLGYEPSSPRNASELIERIRALAEESIARGAAS
jgi:hypothetical protein